MIFRMNIMHAKWVLSFREHTIRFICDYYLPIIYKNCLELIKTKDVEKYYINITTAIRTCFQDIIFNSLKKRFCAIIWLNYWFIPKYWWYHDWWWSKK
ncbi:hypothetical protein SMM_1175 [Spiroplasma mirum ATCC 29335]|nr:hypothetical protein SMM_1175 [Spiroplasma mirum ATCC 29335]